MKKINFLLLSLLFIGLSCSEDKGRFPVNKRYWTHVDYGYVIRELKYGFKSDEKLPSFDDPTTRIVVEKLTDQQNYKVILDDPELGLNYKNEIATEFFDRWRDMNTVYDAVDRKDNYIYEIEMLKIWHFGLKLQQYYFKLGNDQLLENSDDSESRQVQKILQDNINTLISNYTNYLDEVNRENYYSASGLALYAEGIDTYFKQLVTLYPTGNYDTMMYKINAVIKKSDSEMVKTSLKNLRSQIQNRKKDT